MNNVTIKTFCVNYPLTLRNI